MPVHPLAAQEQAGDSDHSIRGVLRNGALLSLHALTSACPPFVARAPKVSEMYVPEDKPLRAWCAVDSTYALPHADGRRWMAAVYGTRLEYEPNDEQKKYILTPRDTDVFVTAVLSWITYVRLLQTERAALRRVGTRVPSSTTEHAAIANDAGELSPSAGTRRLPGDADSVSGAR